jgi:soluble lytic murein transglycosylase-like protein
MWTGEVDASSAMPVRFALIVLLLVAAATPALAQIYSWRDERGTLVLSDRPKPGHDRTHAIATLTAPRTEAVVDNGRDDRNDFDGLIVEHARLHGVRPDLVRAVVEVESGFNPLAVSPKGALGLMQLMPATARQFGVLNPFDPTENVRAGVAYLRHLLDRYDNDERLALAAYNAGPGAVDRHGQAVPPYAETRSYVEKVNRLAGDRPARELTLPGTKIYKAVHIIDGRTVVTYSDREEFVARPTPGVP